MGAERAPDVSDGGYRDHGVFGQAQSDVVAAINDGGGVGVPGYEAGMHYGEWLQDYWLLA
jgi:hypothetical protein